MNPYLTGGIALIAASLGFTAAWQYQAHQIDKINLASETAYSKAQAAVIEKDKRYAQLQSQLSVAIAKQQQTTAQTTASTAAIVRSNGLYVRATCPRLPNASTPASIASDGAAEADFQMQMLKNFGVKPSEQTKPQTMREPVRSMQG